jgi:predicted RNase H-like nuclease (RuvC/YqgF family)
MPTRDFYTLSEAAQILEVPQRRLLERLETGEIEGERDPQSGRWKIPKHAADERVSADPSPEGATEESQGQSAEMLRELVGEFGDLHRHVGHLRSRLDRARRTEREEREQLLAELKQEREGRRQERERANRLHEEASRLREELERAKGSWRRLFGGQD